MLTPRRHRHVELQNSRSIGNSIIMSHSKPALSASASFETELSKSTIPKEISPSVSLKSRINYVEWKLISLFQTTFFFKSRSNRRRVELRMLLSEIAFFLRQTDLAKADPKVAFKGSYDLLKSAHRLVRQWTSKNVRSIQLALNVLMKLDVVIEHSSDHISFKEWSRGLEKIKRLANILSANELVDLCCNLQYMANDHHSPKEDFMHVIWLKCHHLQHVSAQRQTLAILFINIAGEHVRERGVHRLKRPLPRSVYEGDKEVFKSLRNSSIQSTLLKHPSSNVARRINDLIFLRGRRRHVFANFFSLEDLQDELEILLNFSCEYGSVTLEILYQSAMNLCANA